MSFSARVMGRAGVATGGGGDLAGGQALAEPEQAARLDDEAGDGVVAVGEGLERHRLAGHEPAQHRVVGHEQADVDVVARVDGRERRRHRQADAGEELGLGCGLAR